MKIRLNSLCIILFPLILCHLSSCIIDKEDTTLNKDNKKTDTAYTNTQQYYWDSLLQTGNYEILNQLAGTHFRNCIASGDTISAERTAIYLTKNFLNSNKKDSVFKYIQFLEYIKSNNNETKAFLSSTKGHYALRYELDYVKAIKNFNEALDIFSDNKDTSNIVISLYNIASVHYFRHDTTKCLDYCNKAYEISKSGKDFESQCISLISLLQMNYAFGYFQQALSYGKMALETIEKNNVPKSYLSHIYVTMSDANMALGYFDTAYQCILSAYRYKEPASEKDKEIDMKIDIAYGDYLFNTGNFEKAKYIYSKYLNNNTINKNDYQRLINRMAKVYHNMDMKDSALFYYNKYYSTYDSLFNFHSEREYNKVIINSEKEKYQQQIETSEKRINYSTKIILSIILIILASLFFFILLIKKYRKKDNEYSELAKRHNTLISEKETFRKEEKQIPDEQIMHLFNEIEKLMQEKEIYTSNDISVDKIAKFLNTNRTYVSKAINKCSKLTFNNYINKYRISKAIKIIESEGKDLLLKNLYSQIGYKAKSAFYNAFQKEIGCTPTEYIENMKKGTRQID